MLFVAVSVIPAFFVSEEEIMNDQTTRAAQEIINEVRIPDEFLKNSPLEALIPYEQLDAPQEVGRTNPFGPAPQREEAAEEGEDDSIEEGV